MCDETKVKQILSLKSGVFEAVEAVFAMDRAIEDNELSIQDLMDGLALAIEGPRQGEDGQDTVLVSIAMMRFALMQDKTRRVDRAALETEIERKWNARRTAD